jgi:hypothetical protein
MSAYVLYTPAALEVAYSATAGSLTGYATATLLGQEQYQICMTTDAWVAQGIADTTFTVDHTTNIFTATAHGLTTGMPVQVSNSGGALPSGLSAATSYFAAVIDANTFYLYDTRAHAVAGGPTGKVSVSDNGTGTQTATTVATAGSGSAFVPAKTPVLIDAALGAKVSVVRDASSGTASLTPLMAAR